MAYLSNDGGFFGMGFPKKEILMDYIIKSYDLQKVKIAGGIYAYVSRLCDLPKKEIFDGLHKHFWEAFFEKLLKKEI